ncbi:MAG TPA: hypothetical protein VH082_09625 [Rudaea sp.]|jgi:hypothetical protein|nr:hypothetical protein [Rudaea sp.]
MNPSTLTKILPPLILTTALTACGGANSDPHASPTAAPSAGAPAVAPKTESLPADGGDVGKAYAELVSAYQTLDNAKASRHVDGDDGSGDPLTRKEADGYLADMLPMHPVGGLRQADRATLFLDGNNKHSSYSASLVNGNWRFDQANVSTWEETPESASCKTSSRFPCVVTTFPDSRVAGTSVVYRDAPNNSAMPGSSELLDGYGVRMFDATTKQLRYTRLILSNTGFQPHELTSTYVQFWQGTLLLEISPDTKHATLILSNANHGEDFPRVDVTKELSLDTSKPNRVSGHLSIDNKAMAKVDVTFDIATASECAVIETDCLPD